jgi:bacterial/archaeal transporter family-2 protein
MINTHRLRYVALISAFVVGALTAAQARVNGELAEVTGSGLEAAVISFGSGLVLLTLMVISSRRIRSGIETVVTQFKARSFPRWQILGGILGGYFVGVQASAVPLIGVALFTVAVVAGQSVNSLIVDRIGLGPAGVTPITPWRVAAAILAIIGVTVAVSGRIEGPNGVGDSEIHILPVVLALSAGIIIAIQQAINGRISVIARNSFSAAWFNFVFGTTALVVAILFEITKGNMALQSTAGAPWWSYLGGIIGVVFIATAAWVVPRVGVLLFALISISGQLSGALVLDLLAPTAGTELGPQLFLGIGITFIAIALSTVPRLLRSVARR